MEHELNMRLFLLLYLFLLCFVMIVTFGIDRQFDVNKGILYIGLRIGLARTLYTFYLKMFYNSSERKKEERKNSFFLSIILVFVVSICGFFCAPVPMKRNSIRLQIE